MITATVLVIINKAVDTVVVWQTKMQAFEIIRENMEQILAKPSVSDMLEYGESEINPDITWETVIESFYEPITNKLWIRAVCSAEFPDPNGQPQKIELTQWLTGLSEKQIMQILEQKKKLTEYEATFEDSNGVNYQENLKSQDSSQRNTQRPDTGTGRKLQNTDNSDDPELQKALKMLGGRNGN
jgi:hypothetical protein